MLLDLFRFELQAFYLSAKGFAHRNRNFSDSDFEHTPELAQRLHHAIAPGANRIVQPRNVVSRRHNFVFGEKKKKQQQIDIGARFVLQRKAGGGNGGT